MNDTVSYLKRNTLTLLLIGIMSFTFTSCEEEGNGDETPDIDGIYIVNEGMFGHNNGSITLLDPESGEKFDNYFKSINDRSPGDVVQDLAFSDDRGFIVVNNSQKVLIVSKDEFTTLDVIPELTYPRQLMVLNNDFAYLTNGSGQGHVLKIDLNSNTIGDSIEVGIGPESMARVNDLVYVTNAGGYSTDNTVSVIDTRSDEVVETIEVGDVPTDIAKDKNNNLWVFCKGLADYHTGGPTNSSLVRIDTEDHQTTSFDLGKVGSYGNYLLAVSPNKDQLYFVGSTGIYQMGIDDEQVPGEPVIERLPYGLDVNPENGNIYCLISRYQSKGFAFRYDNTHSLIDSVQVGYGPNAIVFE